MPEAETKIGQIALRAYELATAGSPPLDAWLGSLRESYRGVQLENQVQHSCPKWAFSILCQEGHLNGIESGGCPEASQSSSARYAIEGLGLLQGDPSLAQDRRELRGRVFGKRGDAGYRRPNGETEVLVALWMAGAVRRD